MDIKDLPGAGSEFRATYKPGRGSFADKLKKGCKYGDLKNLQDNINAITKTVKGYERVIRRGGLSRKQRIIAWNKIKSIDKNITKEDRREIKGVLEHLGAGKNISSKKLGIQQNQQRESDRIANSRENPLSRAGTTENNVRVGRSALGIKGRMYRTSALGGVHSEDDFLGPKSSTGQKRLSANPVARRFGVNKSFNKPISGPPPSIGGGKGMRPIGL